jgi:transcription initiation factor IIE alpha subunit
MDTKLVKNQLLEVEEGYMFYCNNCNYKFTFVYTFNPIPRLSEYFICSNCNSVLPVKDLKKKRMYNCICKICFL